jgi:hypothetical protein
LLAVDLINHFLTYSAGIPAKRCRLRGRRTSASVPSSGPSSRAVPDCLRLARFSCGQGPRWRCRPVSGPGMATPASTHPRTAP